MEALCFWGCPPICAGVSASVCQKNDLVEFHQIHSSDVLGNKGEGLDFEVKAQGHNRT